MKARKSMAPVKHKLTSRTVDSVPEKSKTVTEKESR